MEGNPDYDTLLRSIFDSCDSTGSGLISTTEFEDLCAQLSLENEYVLLYEYLFQSSTLLSYDRFREGLLQLLAGTLPPNEAACVTEKSSSAKKGEHHDNDMNGNEVSDQEQITCESYKTKSKSDKSFGEHVEEPDWLVIDFHQTSDSKTKDDSRIQPETKHSARKSYSAHKQRKYGRRTLPDTELLSRKQHRYEYSDMNSSRKSVIDRTDLRDDDVNTLGSTPVTPSSRVTVEEFVGEGDGADWTNPDMDVVPMDDTSSNDNNPVNQSSSAEAQEALGAIWQQVIGDLEKNIDVAQLQSLYHALSLTSSGGDVKQLFDILDNDGDGLISFADFARQMSAFLGESMSPVVPSENLNAVADKEATVAFHSTPHHKQSSNMHAVQTPSVNDFVNHPSVHSTPHSIDGQHTPKQTTCHVTPSPANQSSTSGFVSTPHANGQLFSSSPSNTDYSSFSSSTGRLSLEGQTDEFDVRSYEGVPNYRRRRRTNHTTSRNRRRSNKTVALPHYHPMSRRRVEESPFYFLTGENGRYVDVENLHSIWKEDGIEDPDQVLKDLGVNLDDSFSVEILSEAMETEMKDSMIHQAVCCLYKSGIKYYRSKKEHESAERLKLESKVDYLNRQLQEQDERIETMECNFQKRLDEVDTQHKDEVNQLAIELSSVQGKTDTRKDDEIIRLKSQVHELQELERVVRSDLNNLMEEHKTLQTRHQETVQELHVAGVSMNQMRVDFEAACHRMASCSKRQMQQNDRLETLMLEYKESAAQLRDENDELFNDLNQMKKRWHSSDKVALAYTGRIFQPSLSDETHSPKAPIRSGHTTPHRTDICASVERDSTFSSHSSLPSTSQAVRTGEESTTDAWKLPNDPDASISEVSDSVLTPKVLRPQSLFCELEASSPGLV
uniref:Uncharacterized protein LOC100179999 n=1 Tax=Phallusia mammillata TaxID=59560 RepID=A0A6F9DHV9_9ASCI|nr:uncharacterized protein LOC100179999 [Phallusia mammillata]